MTCIANKRVAPMTAPSCLFFWGNKDDDNLERLRRDCSCRGSNAGFFHLSCLVEYAKRENQKWDDSDPDNRNLDYFVKPWQVCPSCKQDYQNTLAVNIVNDFVSFVKRQHPHDKQMQVVALYRTLTSLYNNHHQSQIDEAKEVAEGILILIQETKKDTPVLPKLYTLLEALTYNHLGAIALKEGTEESAKKALVQFEKCLELSTASNFAAGIANAEYNIAFAKSNYMEMMPYTRRTG
jgi:hypothetical protein